MTVTLSSRAVGPFVIGILSLGFLVAAHEPANKMNVSASESEVTFLEASDSQVVLEETLRVSETADLLLG